MLKITINNAGEDGSIEASGTGFVFINDCMNAITAMCNALEPRIGKENTEALMDVIYKQAMDAYCNDDQVVKLVKQTTVKTLGDLLNE